MFNFRRSLSCICPFLQRFHRKCSIWESKVQAFQGQLSGRAPPPLPFGTFWPPPPYPGLPFWARSKTCENGTCENWPSTLRFVSTVKFPVSILVGVFVGSPGPSGAFCTESLNLRGYFCGHLCVHSRMHFHEQFRESSWVKFAVRVLCACLIVIGNASLFTIFAPITPPSQPAKWGISSWISIKRTSNRIANSQPKLRTNPPKIANKQNYEQTGVSDR